MRMLRSYLTLDFGTSFFRDQRVVDLIVQKMPVSISLGLWTTLLIYLISIPLGVAKAVRDGSAFDVWTSGVVIVGYAIPGFLFAILLIVLFAGGSFVGWFPLRGLVSEGWVDMTLAAAHRRLLLAHRATGDGPGGRRLRRAHHADQELLPGGDQQAVRGDGALQGARRQRVLYGHVFRNAMLIVVAGFPAAFVGILFTGALLIEVIFSLDGLGLLGFEAAINRDYPIMFGTLYIYTLVGLVLNLVSDLMYVAIDPRIDFATREA